MNNNESNNNESNNNESNNNESNNNESYNNESNNNESNNNESNNNESYNFIVTDESEPFTVSNCCCKDCEESNNSVKEWDKFIPKTNLQKRMIDVTKKIEIRNKKK